MGVYSWFIIDMGELSPLWEVPPWVSGPELYKNTNWANHEEQVIEQDSSMVSASFPAPASFDDGL